MSDLFKKSSHPVSGTHTPKEPWRAIDPVCGMSVDTRAGKPSFAYDGTTYHFCNPRCREKFAADPEHYIDPGRKIERGMNTGAKDDAKTNYTCPMDPEIVHDGPGTCPICGMALEPMGVPSAEEQPNPELVDFLHRLKVGTALTLSIVRDRDGTACWDSLA